MGFVDWTLVRERKAQAAPDPVPAQFADPAGAFAPGPNPRYRQVQRRAKNQRILMIGALGKKTLTADQARAILKTLRSVDLAEQAYVQGQPGHELTSEQQDGLNRMLDENSGVLGENDAESGQAP